MGPYIWKLLKVERVSKVLAMQEAARILEALRHDA